LYLKGYRGFESLSLRHKVDRFQNFRRIVEFSACFRAKREIFPLKRDRRPFSALINDVKNAGNLSSEIGQSLSISAIDIGFRPHLQVRATCPRANTARGLICVGCTHVQPKKSAVPIFRRMLASHQRSLNAAREHPCRRPRLPPGNWRSSG
jgi:hypothetical protein